MSDNHDWGGGDWWHSLPLFNDEDDDNPIPDNWIEDFGYEPDDIPPVPDYPLIDLSDLSEDDYIPESVFDAWDFLVDIGSVDPSRIRGVAFTTIYEAIEWLQATKLIGFSSVIYNEGYFHPVVGDSIPGDKGEMIPAPESGDGGPISF